MDQAASSFDRDLSNKIILIMMVGLPSHLTGSLATRLFQFIWKTCLSACQSRIALQSVAVMVKKNSANYGIEKQMCTLARFIILFTMVCSTFLSMQQALLLQ